MIIDDQHLYSSAQALTGTAASTNLIDHKADRDMGIGTPLAVLITLDVAAAAGGSYAVALQTDDNSGFSSATTIGSATITSGDAAGTRYIIQVPPSTTFERYTRLNYTVTGGCTATVTASLMTQTGIQNAAAYPDSITIS
jgi:hypothetical protein